MPSQNNKPTRQTFKGHSGDANPALGVPSRVKIDAVSAGGTPTNPKAPTSPVTSNPPMSADIRRRMQGRKVAAPAGAPPVGNNPSSR